MTNVLRTGAPRRRFIALLAAVLLSVTLLAHPAAAAETTEAGDPCSGSSNPTLYSNNHRIAVTVGGRQLIIYDPHGTGGQQLKWRDRGESTWQSATTGAVTDGFIPGNDISTDRPASLAIATDSSGVEHAWLVWGGYTFSQISAIKLRRLSDLDSPSGPTVGPEVILAPAGRGNNRPDLAFEDATSGPRGAVTWLRRTGDTTYQLAVAWLSSLDTDSPTLDNETVLYSGSNSNATATLVPHAKGMRVVARTDKLRVWGHDHTSSLTSWVRGGASATAATKARPSVIAGSDGRIYVALESNVSKHIVKVFRFTATGSGVSNTLTTSTGVYQHPSVASDGTNIWLVMVRRSNDTVVSRQYVIGSSSGWGSDVLEMPGGGNYASPNTLRQVSDKLRFIVDGPRCPTSNSRNAVLAYERLV